MFAREFSTGATAFKSDIAEVYLCLVRFAAAALRFPPKRLFIGTFAHPFVGVG